MKVKKIFLSLITVLLIAILGLMVYKSKQASFVYSSYGVPIPEKFQILGIDVSHHQGDINFEEVMEIGGERDSIQFVYIKVTEGTDFVDSKFDENAEGFARFGMNYGFYHYYQPDKSAVAQALFYCETIKRYNFKLIPVVDIEVIGNRTKAQIVDSLTVYMATVERVLESRPMIYTYKSFYQDYLKGSSLSNELYWMAYYGTRKKHMDNEQVVIWQFSEKGTVNGIETKVDLNVAKKGFYQKVLRKKD